MIPALIALGLGFAGAQSAPSSSALEIRIVILGYGDAEVSRRIVSALAVDNRVGAGLLSVPVSEGMERCLGDDPEPTEARRSCIRDAVSGDWGGAPTVVVALADTRERGSWQRKECIGPRSTGLRRTIHIRDFDHPRQDVSNSVLSSLAECIKEASE